MCKHFKIQQEILAKKRLIAQHDMHIMYSVHLFELLNYVNWTVIWYSNCIFKFFIAEYTMLHISLS